MEKAIKIMSKGKGYEILVDEKDLEALSLYSWHLTQNGYAIAWVNGERMRMTHFLLGRPSKGMVIDHINGVRLDNRRRNLRVVTVQQNAYNTKAVGVRQRGNSWEANVCVMYRKHFKGGFKTKKEALEWRQFTKDSYKKTIWI